MLTIEQIRAGRALLDWSQSDLADHAGLSQTGIARIENGTNQPNSKTLKKIQTAFDDADIEFLGRTGVRKRTGEVKVLHGQEGFVAFMDDVYKSTKKHSGDIRVYNVDEHNWIKWMGDEAYKAHAERMANIETPFDCRILIAEGDDFFIAGGFGEYRWFPKDLSRTCQSFYTYGRKIAFIHFMEDDVRVMILNQRDFADGFAILFDIAWDNVAKTVS